MTAPLLNNSPVQIRTKTEAEYHLDDINIIVNKIILNGIDKPEWMEYVTRISQIESFLFFSPINLEYVHDLTFQSNKSIASEVLRRGCLFAAQARYHPKAFYHYLQSVAYGMTSNLRWMSSIEEKAQDNFEIIPDVYLPQVKSFTTDSVFDLLLCNSWLALVAAFNLYGLVTLNEGNENDAQ